MLLQCIEELLRLNGITEQIFITNPANSTHQSDKIILIQKNKGGGRDIYKTEEFYFSITVKTTKYRDTEEIIENIRDILLTGTYENDKYKVFGFIENTSPFEIELDKYKCIVIYYKSLAIKK